VGAKVQKIGGENLDLCKYSLKYLDISKYMLIFAPELKQNDYGN
jgi:hypothetical protein